MRKITIRQPQVKVTVYLNDASHFARYNSVYAQRFSPPYPARALLAGTGSDPGRRSVLLPLAQGPSGLRRIQRTKGDCARVTSKPDCGLKAVGMIVWQGGKVTL